jgi:hypothetical protein
MASQAVAVRRMMEWFTRSRRNMALPLALALKGVARLQMEPHGSLWLFSMDTQLRVAAHRIG